jgi:hypothetical protein
MDGSVWQHKVGTFHVIPYFARQSIKLPSNLQDLIEISKETLDALVDSKDMGTSEITKDGDYTFDGVHLKEPNKSSDSEVEETNSEIDAVLYSPPPILADSDQTTRSPRTVLRLLPDSKWTTWTLLR